MKFYCVSGKYIADKTKCETFKLTSLRIYRGDLTKKAKN